MVKSAAVKENESEGKEVFVNVLKKGLYDHKMKDSYPFGSHILADDKLKELAQSKQTDDDGKRLVEFEKKRKVA